MRPGGPSESELAARVEDLERRLAARDARDTETRLALERLAAAVDEHVWSVGEQAVPAAVTDAWPGHIADVPAEPAQRAADEAAALRGARDRLESRVRGTVDELCARLEDARNALRQGADRIAEALRGVATQQDVVKVEDVSAERVAALEELMGTRLASLERETAELSDSMQAAIQDLRAAFTRDRDELVASIESEARREAEGRSDERVEALERAVAAISAGVQDLRGQVEESTGALARVHALQAREAEMLERLQQAYGDASLASQMWSRWKETLNRARDAPGGAAIPPPARETDHEDGAA